MEATCRKTIMELVRVHHSPSAIMKITGYSKLTVYRVYKARKEEGKVKYKLHKTCIDKKRTPHLPGQLKPHHQGKSCNESHHSGQEEESLSNDNLEVDGRPGSEVLQVNGLPPADGKDEGDESGEGEETIVKVKGLPFWPQDHFLR